VVLLTTVMSHSNNLRFNNKVQVEDGGKSVDDEAILKLETKVCANVSIVTSESSAASHVHSTQLTIACRGSMPDGMELIDRQVIERLNMADRIPHNILHMACRAMRNDNLKGGLDFSGIVGSGNSTLSYAQAAFKRGDWCGMANGAKTDLIFFNACATLTK
jgi:hypothetical protein